MKKLMFIAAVAVAGLAQAASLDWSIGPKSFLMPDNSQPNGATVYLFNTGASGYSDFVAALTGGTLGDSISATTFTGAAGYLSSGTTYSNTRTQLLNNNYGKANGTVTVGSVGDQTLAVIIYDSASGKYMISDSASGKSYTDNPDDGSAASFDDSKMTKNGWATYTAAGGGGGGGSGGVPEPTSGLLLALGGAMLALRRRRV